MRISTDSLLLLANRRLTEFSKLISAGILHGKFSIEWTFENYSLPQPDFREQRLVVPQNSEKLSFIGISYSKSSRKLTFENAYFWTLENKLLIDF